MKCFHHNDNDGRCAAYWVGKYFQGKDPVEYIEMNYDREFPVDDIKEGENVWIVDFSLEPDMMKKLLKKTKDVIWIDHHESAVEKYKDFPEQIGGLRYIGRSGALLTWYYTQQSDLLDVPADDELEADLAAVYDNCPYATRLVDDYDVFILEMVNTMPFQYGTQALDVSPQGNFWEQVHANEDFLDHVIDGGKTIKVYADKMNTEWRESCGYESTMNGKKCFVMNTPAMGSMSFGPALDEYPFVAKVTWNGEYWLVSLYSNKENGEDVSKIAQKQMYKGKSGGGHVNAAGFFCEELPFKKVKA